MNYPQKKASKKESAVVVVGEALALEFELDFNLIACMANTIMGGVWYLDTSASFNMTGNIDIFSDFEEKGLKQNIEFGDDMRYSAIRLCTVTF